MDNPASDGKQGSGDALRVVLVYAAVAVAWLLLSDNLLAFLVADPAQRVRLGFFKGVLFVAVTASILYWLVRGLQRRARAAERRELAHDVERLRTLRLLRTIADSSDAAVFAKDLEGRYLMLNRAAAAMLGKPAPEIIGSFDHMLLGPGQAAILREAGRNVIEEGREATTEESVALPGGTRTFTVTRGPLRNEQGDIIGLYGFARDVTALQAADEEARRVADDLAATLRAIPDLLFELDGQGRYIRVATTAHNLLAVPEAQLIGRTIGDVLPAEAAHAVMEGIAAAARDGTDYGRIIALPLGGEVRHFELSFARKGESHEAPIRFIVLSRDITQRVRSEVELKRSNEELRRFDSASIGRELRMVELKREINALVIAAGREPPYDMSFLPIDQPGITLNIAELNRVEQQPEQAQAAAIALEHRARLATLNQMQDANAARARAESALAALRLSEAQLGLFIEHAPAALAMFDRDMRYLAVSRRWRDDYQMGERKLIGEAHYEVYPGVRDDWKAIHRRGMAGEVIRNDADRLDRADGTTQWLRWEVRPWRDAGGQVGGIVIFSEDITRQKVAEDEVRSLNEALEARVQERTAELTQANRELDSFAHAVTHDLRGPLRAMDGYVHILEEDYRDRMPADALNLVQQLRRSGVRMGELIDAIYALSNVSRGDIERAPVDVSAMSQSLLETLTRTDPAHRPGWSVEPGMTVEGDRRMLESVMQNLIANAWKYTGKTAHPEIRIHTEIIEGRPWICVTDNGAGFSMAQARRLFTPFQRLHRQEDFPGIGIGLATVLRIIRRHGGDIAAHGEPGRGATFRFTLPASPQAALSRTLRTPALAS